nr:hypothetical protein [Acidocella aminolytica]
MRIAALKAKSGIASAHALRPAGAIEGYFLSQISRWHPADGRPLLHKLRFKTAITVAGNGQRDIAIRALHPLRRNALAAVGLISQHFHTSLLADMPCQFRTQQPFQPPNLQVLHLPGVVPPILKLLAPLQ